MRETPQHRILGLTPREQKVLTFLGNERKSKADIARTTGIADSTLDHLLPRLRRKGWAKRIYVGKKVLWEKESRDTHAELLENAINTLFTHESTVSLKNRSCESFLYIEGLENVRASAISEYINPRNKGRRVFAFQSTETALCVNSKCSVDWTEKHNYKIFDNEIVTENILPGSYYSKLGGQYGVTALKSFKDRLAITNTLPDEYFTDTELFIVGGRVYLTNWFDEYTLQVHEPSTVLLFKHLFSFMQLAGKRINQKKHIEELIEKMERKR